MLASVIFLVVVMHIFDTSAGMMRESQLRELADCTDKLPLIF